MGQTDTDTTVLDNKNLARGRELLERKHVCHSR